MKKAYILEAHRYPQQLLRLVSRLADGQSEFFVHIDKKVDVAPFRNLESFGNVIHWVKREDAKWAGYGSVQATLNGLKAVRDTGKPFDHIFLLSGQCYPIKSNAFIDEFLRTTSYSLFLDYYPIPQYEKWPGRDRGGWYRVDKYYIGLKWHQFFRSKTLNLLSTYLPFLRRRLPQGMRPYTGSAWWSMDAYAMNYILNYDAAHPEYGAFHKHTFVPDELYMHMIVGNSADERLRKSVSTDNKRLILWAKPNSAHPNTLRLADFAVIKSSDALFARKFDPAVDTEILDKIDEEILYADRSAPVNRTTVVVNDKSTEVPH